MGDSTTAGTPGFLSPLEAPPQGRGDPESQYGYWITKARPGWRVFNKGINGQRSDQILARFGRDVMLEKPDLVVILAGVNDIYQGRREDAVKNNLEAMYERAKGSSVAPVAATILPYNSAGPREAASIRNVNSWIASTSKEMGMLFCDTNKAVRDGANPDLLASTPDGLHPDVDGYRKMGEAIVKALADAGY
jgi:lysophospholipase L1-like esterase